MVIMYPSTATEYTMAMAKRLPPEVVEFLLAHPDEVQHVRHRMVDMEERRTRPAREEAERKRRAALPLKPCAGGGYGCGTLTPGGYACDSCAQEQHDDPDAFK
jgi:hypothetical protein